MNISSLHTDADACFQVYWTALPCENYQLVMAISLLTKHGSKIMQEKYGFTEILKVRFGVLWHPNVAIVGRVC